MTDRQPTGLYPAHLALHVLTDRNWSRGRSVTEIVTAALAGGADSIQLRDKQWSTRELIEAGRRLLDLTRQAGKLLIINDRIDVALAVGADGVHLGPDDMPVAVARQSLGPRFIIGASAGTVEEAVAAERDGATYLGVGAMYATRTKSNAGAPVGPSRLTEIRAQVTLPLIAIGGVTAVCVPELLAAGANGIAVITAVVNAENVEAATRELKQALQKRGG